MMKKTLSYFSRWSGSSAVTAAFFAAAAAGMTAAALTGCSSKTESAKTSVKIGISLYDQYDEFLSEMMEIVVSEAGRLKEERGITVNLEMMDAALSQTTQNDQVRKLLEKGCDVICVNLVDRTEPTTITDLAEKNNVPVVFFNRELVAEDLERWNRLYYVGADAFQSGILQGEIAAEVFAADPAKDKNGDGSIQYVVLEGEAGHQDSIVRTEYSVNTLMEKGMEVEKLGYAIANWSRAQAKTHTSSMLAEYGEKIELILANNDAMALGAIDALETAGIEMEDWPVIVGIDGTEDGLEAVREQKMAGTVYNDKEGQAVNMLLLAYDLAMGEGTDNVPLENGKYIRMPYAPITPENIEEY